MPKACANSHPGVPPCYAEQVDSGANISDCGNYRYSLWRRWDYEQPSVLFIMLNPSTADAELDDPTIRRCMGFARDWGYGGVRVCNLYAWRATKPAALKEVLEPIGKWNDLSIAGGALDAGRIIAAWGAWPGPNPKRTARVQTLLRGRNVEALGLTKDGSPRHPLYVRGDTEPIPYWD